jgi:hypothetical protein
MLQQLGRITDAEADRLGKMMSRFEQQHASRLKRNRSR